MVFRWPIEIDGEQLGLPFLIAWWIFPWFSITNNQRVGFLIHEDCWIGGPGPVSHRKPCRRIFFGGYGTRKRIDI